MVYKERLRNYNEEIHTMEELLGKLSAKIMGRVENTENLKKLFEMFAFKYNGYLFLDEFIRLMHFATK